MSKTYEIRLEIRINCHWSPRSKEIFDDSTYINGERGRQSKVQLII